MSAPGRVLGVIPDRINSRKIQVDYLAPANRTGAGRQRAIILFRIMAVEYAGD